MPRRLLAAWHTDEWGSISPAERFIASLLTNTQASVWLTGEAVMAFPRPSVMASHVQCGAIFYLVAMFSGQSCQGEMLRNYAFAALQTAGI
jgi:hypothetical protein